MDKNAGYIPRFLTAYSGPGSGASRAFQILVRGIGEAKSKYEEDKIIREEFAGLREKINQPFSSKQMKEYLIRLIYCEMLGIDASAFHIHAINFAQQRNLHDKRIGYLALSIFLHENHSLILLLINTLQRDLTSTNVLEVCYALTAVNKLINAEMIPTVLDQVLALLNSKRDIIRKKAVMALHTIYKKSPSLVPDIKERAIKALNDRDFSVSSASLHILYDLITEDPSSYKDLVPVFVSLLTKIITGKLNLEFEFHKVPAPWAQIKILRILALLGAYDLQASKKIYDVLQKTLSLLNTSTLIGFAVAYECTRTIASIYPDKKLKKLVSKCVGLFLVANSNDIKYLGINALTSLIDVDASFATDPSYQRIVINCLDDPDETLKRKTLDLLCRITNADNVESICDRLIKHLRNTVDIYFRTDLVTRVTELAERYAPDNSWYILTMNEVLELGGDLVREDVAHNLMRLIAEGNEDEEAEEELRRFAVISYMDVLEKPVLPDILVQVISWIVGEYSYAATEIDHNVIIEKICSLLDRNYSDPTTKRWIVSSLGKLTSRTNGQLPDIVENALRKISLDDDVDIRQRCHEIRMLSKDLPTIQSVMPIDASCEDLEVDSTLSFLDDFVTKALQNGASPYKPVAERKNEQHEESKEEKHIEPTLKTTPYQLPQRVHAIQTQPQTDTTPEKPEEKVKKHKSSKHKVTEEPSRPLSGIKGPWGPKGYTKGHGSTGSGSVDSGSMSGSSSKSSGSEKVPVVKTTAEPTTSPLVFAHEDQAKQAVVDDIFKGVGASSSLQNKKKGVRGNPKTSRTPRSKIPDFPSFPDPSSPPAVPTRTYLDKDAQKSKNEIDLLLDLDPGDNTAKNEPGDNTDKNEPGDYTDKNEPYTYKNKPGDCTDKMDGVEKEHSPTNDHLLTLNDDKEESRTNALVSPSSSAASSEVSTLPSGTANLEDSTAVDLLGGESEKDALQDLDSVTRTQEQSSPSTKSPAYLLDTEISENTTSLPLEESSTASLMLPAELHEYPCAPDKIELCSDANLRVTLQKVYKPDELVLVLFLTNQSQGNSVITDIVTVLEPPSNLRAMFDSTSGNRFVHAELEPLSSVTHCVSLQYKSPALHMSLGGKISYKDFTNTVKHLFISTTLPIKDLVRSLHIDTEAFGTYWSETPFEKRKAINSKVSDADKFLEIVQNGLGLKKVDIIGTKAISAGTILQGPVCLLHGTVDSDGTLDVRIKTNSQLLSDALIKQCSNIFK